MNHNSFGKNGIDPHPQPGETDTPGIYASAKVEMSSYLLNPRYESFFPSMQRKGKHRSSFVTNFHFKGLGFAHLKDYC